MYLGPAPRSTSQNCEKFIQVKNSSELIERHGED